MPTPSATPSTTTSIQAAITALLRTAVEAYQSALPPETRALLPAEPFQIGLELPRNAQHGDWACSLAMKLAKPLKLNPFDIATGIVAHIPANDLIAPPEIARPGFINFRLAPAAVAQLIATVFTRGSEFGNSDANAAHKVLIEFVSANPTGPLHVGHCRGAVVGDSLARIYAAAGFQVSREYYYNDAGVQMQNLGKSMRARYLQALGLDEPFPEEGYHGDYLVEFATDLVAERGDALKSETDWKPFTEYASKRVMKLIDADMAALRIHFDTYFSETTLHESGQVAKVLEKLKTDGRLYEKEGAWWLRTEEYGDEKDRVVIKTDGNYTYLAPDIAYHEYKFERGFDRLVDVLGGDHHGYVPRLKAAIGAMGHQPEQLDCAIVQMVTVERGGAPVKLGKRAGDYITLKEVIDEIGVDVTRFLFLTRTTDSQMVFDYDVARDTSMENPVYYVQYAHARCCSILKKAEETGHPFWGSSRLNEIDLTLLSAPEERAIAREMDRLPLVILDIARNAEPMPLTAYLRDLATAFHSYYTAGSKDEALRVLQANNPALTQSRLALITALKQVYANALQLLGVTPLDRL